ncbi:MAG TPA: helix-turn-helix transcriptional regulator [Thermoanaerobaculia bacterium]|jgi:transcriptional regulator with XRE-family HTH domain|nr:helix-turn-helix transcriptional regulator [Thermoanaerobaculia bacterium]
MESQTAHLIKVLKSAIGRLGFTQKEVERRLGLSQGYLSRLFGGKIDLKVDHVVQIANVLQVEPEEMFRLAFPAMRGEPTFQAQLLQGAFGLRPPEPPPETVSDIEKEIERIVERALARSRGS